MFIFPNKMIIENYKERRASKTEYQEWNKFQTNVKKSVNTAESSAPSQPTNTFTANGDAELLYKKARIWTERK